MNVEWFCQLMGSELGPFTPTQLVDMARRHQITPEDMIKKGKEGEWVLAYRVKGLFEAAASPTHSPAPARPKPPRKTAQQTPPHHVPQHIDTEVQTPVRRMWFYISDGEKFGPMSFEMLQRRAASGDIHASDRVWSNTCPKWSRASEVKGLDLYSM